MPSPNGQVNITIADGGGAQAVVPQNSTILAIGCSSAGTPAQIVASQNPATFLSSLGPGPLTELCALLAQAGATVLACKAATNTPGSQKPVQATITGGSTCVVTTTGNAFDNAFVKFLVVASGTIGTAGITFQISLDGGRTYGPTLSLGTASTYAIPNTGVTLAFAAGTLVAGDSFQFQTLGPTWNDAGVQACLQAYQASQYALDGVGSIIIDGPCAGADATVFEGYLDSLASGFVYQRAMVNARDAAAPAAWTGSSSEPESTWLASLGTDYSAVAARRICASGGFYNMASPYSNPAAGAPRYRRPLSWALACRQVNIPPQRLASRVKDGPLAQIVVDPTKDPMDGFVYHDERINPGLDVARFTSAWTRVKSTGGFFIDNPNLMSPPGSNFPLLPHGDVMDIVCDVVQQTAQTELDDDVRLNPSGTIYESDARNFEEVVGVELQAQVTAAKLASAASVVVDRTWNVGSTGIVQMTVSVLPRGYVRAVNVTIAFILPGQGT